MNTGSIFAPGAAPGQQPQPIVDDFVESLVEIGSFFMPSGLVVTPVNYINDCSHGILLQSNILQAEICSQKIVEYAESFTISLSGLIVQGFRKPQQFNFFLSHSFPPAKVFPGRDNLQIFELSEFLSLEYPESSLILTNILFSLYFTDYRNGNEPSSAYNGGGFLLFADE